MRLLLLYLGCASLFYSAEQKFWDKQEPATWTPQQISQLITASPWAKQVTALLVTNDSNMASSSVRGSGRDRGGRSASSGPSPDALPKWQAVVRWTSAKPMQQVLKTHLPDTFQGQYVISVSGLPISADTAELLEQTSLQVKRNDPVHPELAFQDPADTSTVYFAFVPSMVDASDSRSAVFTMLASPYEIKARFNVAEMKYRGQPAL